ncbi:hypothetical protein J2S74_002175 [Evansella vedderi]|uniref:Uncharacterized protein n=1 Tax=Evansella vedderi TaxID=38282 RepID=A0ABT9ZU70_9BACI|nr:hypothetical protein [Evansella vedderi]MDQ0254796.1 hypothetical protein [Evansella vedderi]
MARGKSFNHKRKSHPGDFPKGSERVESKKEERSEIEEYLGTHEAFKNRVADDE